MLAQRKKGVEVHVNSNDMYNKCVLQKEMRDLQLHTIDRVTPYINDNKVFLITIRSACDNYILLRKCTYHQV